MAHCVSDTVPGTLESLFLVTLTGNMQCGNSYSHFTSKQTKSYKVKWVASTQLLIQVKVCMT